MANPAQTLDVRTLNGIFGSATLGPGAAGVIAAGATTKLFLDSLGSNTNSRVTQTVADSNFWSGYTPNQETYTLFGFQVQIWEVDANYVAQATTNVIIQEALRNISFSLSLKGQEYQIGSLMTVPCPLGSNGLPQNGGRAVAPFRFPRALPLQLGSMDQFYVNVRAERPINVAAGTTNEIGIFIYCPASRGIPLGQLSGA